MTIRDVMSGNDTTEGLRGEIRVEEQQKVSWAANYYCVAGDRMLQVSVARGGCRGDGRWRWPRRRCGTAVFIYKTGGKKRSGDSQGGWKRANVENEGMAWTEQLAGFAWMGGMLDAVEQGGAVVEGIGFDALS